MFRNLFQAQHTAKSVFLLAVVMVSAQASSEESDIMKEKRAGVLRLFPFPRVGRTDPELRPTGLMDSGRWDGDDLTSKKSQYLHEVAEYLLGSGAAAAGSDSGATDVFDDEYDADVLRYVQPITNAIEQQNMQQRHRPFQHFVRPARAGTGHRDLKALRADMKRGLPASANGMWFGPRLGRVQKRGGSLTATAVNAEDNADRAIAQDQQLLQ